jgi:DNA adenine methylase
MEPYKMAKIICEWSNLLNKYDVKFVNTSYEYILPLSEKNDFIYLDPPYANSSSKMYQHDIFDNLKMFDMLRECPCKYALSYDGRVEDEDNTFNVPTDIYKRHEYINARNSAFRRIVTQKTKEVNESLYMNYEKP